MNFGEIGSDFGEFAKTLSWYSRRKLLLAGMVFDTGKSMIVTVLKAHRGTYQKPFLHVGMVFLMATAVLSAPVIVNQYPMTATAASSTGAMTAVLSASTDITSVDVQTIESEKPRRDVEDYTVVSGDTLSSIAKKYGVDTDSIAYLNDFEDNKILLPGDVVKIPPVSGIIVTVKSGDTIESLAKKYGLPSSQPIVDWPYNSFVNDETFSLAAGQQLVIPGGKPPTVAPVALRSVSTPTLFAHGSGQFIWPVSGVITQYFSWYHPALDIAGPQGDPVSAADSGRVVTVDWMPGGYGNYVIIDHGNGYRTLYAHLFKVLTSVGENLSRGQELGLRGTTGRSTGPHTHFEIFHNGVRINPLTALP